MLEILRLNNRPHLGILLAFIDLNRLGRSHRTHHRVQIVKSLTGALKAQQGATCPKPEQSLLVNSDARNGMAGDECPISTEIHELPLRAVELKLSVKPGDRRIRN